MPITITLAELVASNDTWQKIIVADLPIKTAYWIGKKYKKVAAEIVDYEKKHNDLVRKHGSPVEDKPGTIQVSPEGMEAFMKEIGALREIVISLDIDPINLDDLSRINLTGRDLMLMEKFIEE